MSEVWPAPAVEGAIPLPVWARPEERRAFIPWSGGTADQPESGAALPECFDPDAIRAQAFAEGLTEGRRTVEAEVAAERDAVARLAEALENLRPEPPRELGLLLAETVKRLVGQIVGEVAIDGDALLERAHAAAEAVADETGPVRMRLHPDDHERLRGARIDVEMLSDSHLSPGTILLETGDGWIEDGPQVRLEKLRAALDRLGAPR